MQAAIQISQYGVKQAWVGAGLVPGASKPVPSPAAAITAAQDTATPLLRRILLAKGPATALIVSRISVH
jgi:hypothetical protein